MPGLIDAHIHIESSMLTPREFAREAIKHGSIAVVSDPHEIANVMGVEGIDFMIGDAKSAKMKFYFGAPSCVPATSIETSGASLTLDLTKKLLARKDIWFLSEMMNFPGALNKDADVMGKINFAKTLGKTIDGHAPGLNKEEIIKYINCGIETDHETTNVDEALHKIENGMKIQIREGSAAKNFNELSSLIEKHPGKIMLCSDDLHPDDLVKGHINLMVKRAIQKGYKIENIIKAATITAINHYRLNVGMLRINDPADFIIVNNLNDFDVLETFINGEKVYCGERVNTKENKPRIINKFNVRRKMIENDIKVFSTKKTKIKVIQAFDKSLFTKKIIVDAKIINKEICPDTSRDILKIVIVNRYKETQPAVGFINGFNLKEGAFASCIAHDSHNILAVGTNDFDLIDSINTIIRNKGGLAVSNKKRRMEMKLPIGGIMSDKPARIVAEEYKILNDLIRKMGCLFTSPLMTLSFMALLVIPELKLGDKGLFDVNAFRLTNLKC